MAYHDQLGFVVKTKVQTEWIAAVATVALNVRQDANLLTVVSALAEPHELGIVFSQLGLGWGGVKRGLILILAIEVSGRRAFPKLELPHDGRYGFKDLPFLVKIGKIISACRVVCLGQNENARGSEIRSKFKLVLKGTRKCFEPLDKACFRPECGHLLFRAVGSLQRLLESIL